NKTRFHTLRRPWPPPSNIHRPPSETLFHQSPVGLSQPIIQPPNNLSNPRVIPPTFHGAMTSLPSSDTTAASVSDDDLLPILQHAIPSATSYRHVDGVISQANAEGARILARYPSTVSEKLQDGEDDGDDDDDGAMASHEHESRLVVRTSSRRRRADLNHNDNNNQLGEEEDYEEMELFLKRVRASSYAHKSWTDMRRTLVYLRTEVRFYNEFVPLLLSSSSSNSSSSSSPEDDSNSKLHQMIPKCHHASYYLEGLIDESSPATDVRAPPPERLSSLLHDRGGHILLRSLSSPSHFQSSPISPRQSLSCLVSLAGLHASSLGDLPLLTLASRRLSPAGGSYHLRFRNPRELSDIVSSWEGFRRRFWEGMDGDVDSCQGEKGRWKGLLEKPSVVNLGRRMRDMAEWVSDELSPGVEDEWAVIVHGDFKAMVSGS
ncbi:hypothetical protein ACHAXS_003380, partial [Conticribra weissflogii]